MIQIKFSLNKLDWNGGTNVRKRNYCKLTCLFAYINEKILKTQNPECFLSSSHNKYFKVFAAENNVKVQGNLGNT